LNDATQKALSSVPISLFKLYFGTTFEHFGGARRVMGQFVDQMGNCFDEISSRCGGIYVTL
jgi:hypothetical protein